MSALLEAPFASQFNQTRSSKLPMDIRGRTSKETNPKTKWKEKRDAGDLVAKKPLENIRKHSAHTRHRNGIINAAEKNRLVNTEKQMDRLQRRATANIFRYQHQLKQELYEMEASRRALRSHSVTVVSSQTHTDMKGLSKFAARGTYLYSIRNETRSLKEEMESHNSRLEQATKLLKPARRQSVIALDNGKNTGSNPPDAYHEVGRRISMARLDFEIDDDERLLGLGERVATAPEKTRQEQNISSPSPFDMVKLRSELGPELQKELDDLEIDDGIGPGMCLVPIHPNPNHEVQVGPVETNPAPARDVRKASPKPTAKLKLPPVQVNRNFVLKKSSSKQLLAAVAKPRLSTVSENQ